MALPSSASGSPWQLTLPEEFGLAACQLAVSGGQTERAIRAACVLELGLAGKLVVGDSTRWSAGCRLIRGNIALDVSDPAPTGDSLLDGVLSALAANSDMPRRGVSNAYQLRLIQRSLLSHTGRSRVLRRDLYEPHAGSVGRIHTRLRAAVEGREPLDVRTVALSVALGYPRFREPLKRARDVVYEQIDPHAAELKAWAHIKKRDEMYETLDGLASTYRAQVEAGDSAQDRASALALCDVIDAVRYARPERDEQ